MDTFPQWKAKTTVLMTCVNRWSVGTGRIFTQLSIVALTGAMMEGSRPTDEKLTPIDTPSREHKSLLDADDDVWGIAQRVSNPIRAS